MLAFLQYLFAHLIAEYAAAPGTPDGAPDWVGIALAVAAFVLAARVVGAVLARTGSPDDPGALSRAMSASTAGRLAALWTFYVISTSLFGARLPESLGVTDWVLVPHLVRLVPYFALAAGLAWGLQPATAALRLGARTGLAAIADECRQAILPLAPVLVLATFQDLTNRVDQTTTLGRTFLILRQLPALQSFVSLGVVFCALLAFPFALRLWGAARPLPPGPLRDRLEAYSRRIGFRYREILVWPTNDGTLNAAVVGPLPRFRYVVITDALLETLGPDEVEAVFAHEAGHARRGHILLFFGFTAVLGLAGLLPLPGAAAFLETLLAPLPPLVRMLALLAVWLGVMFGWVSRRFEQEADVFGIETLPLADPSADPATHPFARAMERIGSEVGAIREMTGWRHFSIADRVDFIRRYLADESVRRRYRRSIVTLRTVLLCVIGGFTLVAAAQVPAEAQIARVAWEQLSRPDILVTSALDAAVAEPRPFRRAMAFAGAGNLAELAGRPAESLRWTREAAALAPGNPAVLFAYADRLAKAGRPLGARLVWDSLAARADLPEAVRELARKRLQEEPPK